MNHSDLRARVLAEAAAAPSPTRVAHRRRVLVVLAVGALATALLFMAMGGFAAGARPIELIAATAGSAILAAVVLTRLSAGRRGSMLGQPRSVLLAAVVVAAPLLALVALLATRVWPAAESEPVAGAYAACGVMSLAQGALPLLALLVLRRGTDPVHPMVTGAAMGMTAGAWSVVMAYLRCPHAEATHGIVAHVLPTLVLTALGAGLGGWLLRVK
jgi:hypothetical protein